MSQLHYWSFCNNCTNKNHDFLQGGMIVSTVAFLQEGMCPFHVEFTFSLCLCGLSMDTLASTYSPKTWLGYLVTFQISCRF